MPLEAGCSASDAALPAIPVGLEQAAACGFSFTGTIDASTLRVRSEVRDSCAAGKCGAYGCNWSCPPACGTLEECEQQIRRYQAGLLLQTTGCLEDSFDYEQMSRLGALHNRRLLDFQKYLIELFGPAIPGSVPPFLLLGSGGCKVCESCSCPQSPCRFPAQMIVSMEAMGLLVSEVCTANGVPYYRGPGTLTYVGCVLIPGDKAQQTPSG